MSTRKQTLDVPPRARPWRWLSAVAVALCCGSHVTSAAPTQALDPGDLVAVRKLAQERYADLYQQCVDIKPKETNAAANELAFLEIAGMFSLFFHNFPYGENLSERTYDALSIADAFRHAFECSPHWDKRHYLTKALKVLSRRRRELADEDRPETKDELTSLTEAYRTIDKRLVGLTRTEFLPVQSGSKSPPNATPTVEPETAREERGYWAHWRERLSLRVQLGGGLLRFRNVDADIPESTEQTPGALALALSPGVRLLAGKLRRHVFRVGFPYAIYRFELSDPSGGTVTHWAHTMTASLSYGFRLHPRWVSAHVGVSFGLEAHPSNTSSQAFGREIFGVSTSVCTWGEAFCAQVRGFGAIPSADNYMNGIIFAAGLDVFRVADNVLRKRAESE